MDCQSVLPSLQAKECALSFSLDWTVAHMRSVYARGMLSQPRCRPRYRSVVEASLANWLRPTHTTCADQDKKAHFHN